MGGDFGGAGLGVQAGQAFGVAGLQAAAAGLGELGADRATVGHTTTVFGQHRIQPNTPLRIGGCGHHLSHGNNLEHRYDKNP
ncbi:hypothetical protein [Dactylosporangium sp. CA-233914]|uniref:hypothetical protein n=1 Tax=Dactylosporangium sp. CA-233914 TaxID=3239934 RepID=UPI003D935EB4